MYELKKGGKMINKNIWKGKYCIGLHDIFRANSNPLSLPSMAAFGWNPFQLEYLWGPFILCGRTRHESRSTIGPKPRPILGLLTPRWEIRGEIKSGSMVLGRNGRWGEGRWPSVIFLFSLSFYTHSDTHISRLVFTISTMARTCIGLL